MRPLVTVTTVLFNSERSLGRYARDLVPALAEGLVDVIGVDNASPDGAGATFERLMPGSRLISSPVNVGFAAGCNLAWPQVATDYWMLLNPDVTADPGRIATLVRWMDDHPDVALASPMLRDEDGRSLPIARPHDSLWRPVIETLRMHKLLPDRLRSRWLLAGRRMTPERVDGWVPGAALIARTEAVREVGSLNDKLFMYGEDREWCWRMASAGWKIGVCGEVEFTHLGGESARATWGTEERAAHEVRGHLAATRLMRGATWTRVFAALTGVALRLEALDRRRDPHTRVESQLRARLYFRAARKRIAQSE